MAVDPRFFRTVGPFPLADIAALVGGKAEHDGSMMLFGVAALEAAAPSELSFCEAARYADALKATRAAAVLVPSSLAGAVPGGCIAIVCDQPAIAFARAAAMFHPPLSIGHRIHPSACVSGTASIGDDCEIGAFAIVGDNARVGRGSFIGPHAHVARGVILGEECVIHSHVAISHAVCGDRVVVFAGARIGQEGFGFSATKDGRFVTAPQLGVVELGDDVQIGANSCVDRGSLGNTILGRGTRIDNLVQVGHNVRLGTGCILVAQVGVSGSTVMEDYVTAGGQSGFAGHLTIGRGARIAAQSGVMDDIPPGIEVFGSPGRPIREAVRSLHVLRKLTAESRNVKKREAE